MIVAASVGIGFAAHAIFSTTRSHFVAQTCTVGTYDLDTDQASVAATMVGAVTKYRTRLPERASVLVLAAALQESHLTNLAPGDGDRDSVGVLQQRPSQGWGHGQAAPLEDVGEATREFLNALVKVPGWQTAPLSEAVQAVQISADGSAYAQHEPQAQALADAFQGLRAQGVTCSYPTPSKVAPATTVAAQARAQLGISTPRAVGHRVEVPGAGWQTVAWFVANGNRLGIAQVDYAGRRWTPADGWRTQSGVSAAAVVATMQQTGRTG